MKEKSGQQKRGAGGKEKEVEREEKVSEPIEGNIERRREPWKKEME